MWNQVFMRSARTISKVSLSFRRDLLNQPVKPGHAAISRGCSVGGFRVRPKLCFLFCFVLLFYKKGQVNCKEKHGYIRSWNISEKSRHPSPALFFPSCPPSWEASVTFSGSELADLCWCFYAYSHSRSFYWKLECTVLLANLPAGLVSYWCGSQGSCKSDALIGPRGTTGDEGRGCGGGRVSTGLTKHRPWRRLPSWERTQNAVSPGHALWIRTVLLPAALSPTKPQRWRRGEGGVQGQGWGRCPQDLRGCSFKAAKITVITLTQHCPVPGPIPYKHWQRGQMTRWGCECERCTCTHVHACVYTSTLAAWSDDEMGGCECERYICTHVHACVYISTLAAWSDHEMGGWECERYRCTHVHACVYISLHQCTVQNCLETT